jgi:hypothetical protein
VIGFSSAVGQAESAGKMNPSSLQEITNEEISVDGYVGRYNRVGRAAAANTSSSRWSDGETRDKLGWSDHEFQEEESPQETR